jgi:D-inositol-3-phosphate glycosyltransferase
MTTADEPPIEILPGAAAPRLGMTTDDGPPAGVRVVLDVRALQAPERAPTTAAYLDGLLGAYDAQPLAGESFALLLQSDLADPTERFTNLQVIGRRLLPPTRLLRGAALTIDPVVLGGASLGAAWRADRGGAAGSVYHTASGQMPIVSWIPVVASLLDLAPWELPNVYQRGGAARVGQRLRARLLRDAAAVIVGTEAVAEAARRRLRIRPERLRVVPLAARASFVPGAGTPANPADRARSGKPGADRRAEQTRLGLPERYFVYSGRFDARQDLATLLRALAEISAAGRPDDLPEAVAWPPRVLLVGASPDDRAALARAAAREGVAECLAYAPVLPEARLAALVAGARAAILPVVTDSTGLSAIEALACATPVVASAVGALPEIVGSAGIIVEPREPSRLAVALATAWSDERVYERLLVAAREHAAGPRRTWADVARETRAVYADVGVRRAA